jgi:pectinesterase
MITLPRLFPVRLQLFRLGLCLLCCQAVAHAADNASPKKIRIVLVGDSTVTDHAGWGRGFVRYLTGDVECINTSQGGRSSRSFINEGRLKKAVELHGDYYLIQFGHNDQPGKGPERETDPATTYPEFLTQYIDAVRAIGAQPILVTSLVRRNFDPAHPDKILSTLTPYADAVKKLGAEINVPVIDLHASSLAFCEKLGPEKTAAFNPVKDGTADTTHLDGKGSVVFAGLVVNELRQLVPALAPYLTTTPSAADHYQPADVAGKAIAPAPGAIVSADNSGTHLTVSAAVAAAPAGSDKPFVIVIKPGVYREHVRIPADKPFITLRGEPGETAATVITCADNVNTPGGNGAKLPTRQSATVLVQGANFTAENITFENTTTREAHVQALAIYVEADRAAFSKCRFLGWQDTVRVEKGRQYFADCFISGHVDFIYGGGTAVFDRCEILARADGYLTAASTAEGSPFGLVFLDCRVTAGPAVSKGFYLGRPWRAHAATAFIRTELPAQLRAEGWNDWKKTDLEKTARYREYGNTGPGAKADGRVAWARALTDEEAKAFTVENILGGKDGWQPAKAFSEARR